MGTPPPRPRPRRGRAVALIASTVTVAAGVGWVGVDSWQQVGRTSSPSLDLLLAAVAATGAGMVLAWCALVVVVVALGALPGRLGAAASAVGCGIAPARARRRVRLTLGLAMSAAQVGLAMSPSAAAPESWTASSVAVSGPEASTMTGPQGVLPEDLPRIGRPPVAPPAGPVAPAAPPGVAMPAPREPAPRTPSAPDEDARSTDAAHEDRASDDAVQQAGQRRRVMVEPGDTLWDIAADHLDKKPTPRAVSREWPLWFAANRDVIGPDPDVIRPGVVLVEPASPPHTPDEE